MPLEFVLGILGSIASISSIPLAIYLYLRGRDAKYSKLRREIVRVLSHQLGEGRELSSFEIQSVIDSKIREVRGNPNAISVNEIVEDLVGEVISNPILESKRKESILENLRNVHSRGSILFLIDNNQFLASLLQHVRDIEFGVPELDEQVSQAIREYEIRNNIAQTQNQPLSALYASIGSIVTGSAIVLSLLAASTETFNRIFGEYNEIFLSFIISIVASLVASGIMYFRKYKESKPKITVIERENPVTESEEVESLDQ